MVEKMRDLENDIIIAGQANKRTFLHLVYKGSAQIEPYNSQKEQKG